MFLALRCNTLHYGILQKEFIMAKETIAFRLDQDKKAILDAIAQSLDRDRSYVINEAVSAYIELHKWQVEEIKQAIAEADAGEFADDAKISKFFDKWRE